MTKSISSSNVLVCHYLTLISILVISRFKLQWWWWLLLRRRRSLLLLFSVFHLYPSLPSLFSSFHSHVFCFPFLWSEFSEKVNKSENTQTLWLFRSKSPPIRDNPSWWPPTYPTFSYFVVWLPSTLQISPYVFQRLRSG